MCARRARVANVKIHKNRHFSSAIASSNPPHDLMNHFLCLLNTFSSKYFTSIVCIFQLVFVSLSANRGPRRHDGSAPPYLSAPPRDKMPMMLLLAKPHFTALFGLLEQLSNFDYPAHSNVVSARIPHTHAHLTHARTFYRAVRAAGAAVKLRLPCTQ